ncbi:MAG: DUF2911 domain-containing protein [Microscillaceae bacterium]|nr:DUF2911 domain-containing protein [Microscillaceae bacterium]
MLKKSSLLCLMVCLLLFFSELKAQLTTPYDSPKAQVMQRIGITDVTVTFYRPSVGGREIWGKLVPYGFNDLGFGTSKAAPWRAGANDNTTILLSNDVKVAGQLLKAGIYGLHMALEESGKVIVIFSKNSSSWGSYYYQEKEDVLRITTQWEDAPMQEMLTYEFSEVTTNAAVLALRWEKKRIPFKIEVNTHDQVVANFENELRSSIGFNWTAWNTAAQYCLINQVHLEKGLEWADASIHAPFIGQKNFTTLSTKAQILSKLNREKEALTIMDEALPMGTVIEIHTYGRQLLAQGNKTKALEVFKLNAKKFPNTWPVDFGLARGYSANGDFQTALKHANLALKQVPAGDQANKTNLENAIQLLKNGKDIN